MRDPAVIDALEALDRCARAFDEFSAAQDANYSARSFVRWVRFGGLAGHRAAKADMRARERIVRLIARR